MNFTSQNAHAFTPDVIPKDFSKTLIPHLLKYSDLLSPNFLVNRLKFI